MELAERRRQEWRQGDASAQLRRNVAPFAASWSRQCLIGYHSAAPVIQPRQLREPLLLGPTFDLVRAQLSAGPASRLSALAGGPVWESLALAAAAAIRRQRTMNKGAGKCRSWLLSQPSRWTARCGFIWLE